jgi:mannose-6-phosphate isomerase-like protein (cupin superfamily)
LPEAVLAGHGKTWLVSQFSCANDWPNWEMHPEADEIMYLADGRAHLLLEQPSGVQRIGLAAPSMPVVPRGVWHTAQTAESCCRLFITMDVGTKHRRAR